MAKKKVTKKSTIIKITYCSNYNGANVEVNGKYPDDSKAETVIDTVVNFAVDNCNGEGMFYGDIDDVEEVAIKAVKDVYGNDVEVVFEEDSVSS